jgi:streptogramin lyase
VAATADAVNRLTVAAPATLLNHAGSGHQLKLNKATVADTASLLFQTGFSGRAEMGTAGTDAFGIKVSANGSVWFMALEADGATGRVTLPAPLTLGGASR